MKNIERASTKLEDITATREAMALIVRDGRRDDLAYFSRADAGFAFLSVRSGVEAAAIRYLRGGRYSREWASGRVAALGFRDGGTIYRWFFLLDELSVRRAGVHSATRSLGFRELLECLAVSLGSSDTVADEFGQDQVGRG